MVECWNIGMKIGKWTILKEILNLVFLIILTGFYFLVFSAKILHQNKKIDEILCVSNAGFFKPIIPLFQHSIIPIVIVQVLATSHR